jgi:cyclohexyl-isocyanide hydratase
MSTPAARPAPPFRIGMIIFPDMTNLDFAGPFDVLAHMPDTIINVLAKTLDPVRTDIGGVVLPDTTLDECPPLDMLFVGGGPGVNALLEDEIVLEFFRARAPRAQWITSVCTGALVLGAAGLLRGYKAATHWTAMEVLRPLGAMPTYERVVVDRNRITGGGVTAGIDFALTIAKLLHGADIAQAIQLGMEYDPAPPFNTGSPRVAPGHLVESVRKRAAALTEERFSLAKRIGQKHGWA